MQADSQVGGTAGPESPVQSQDHHTVAQTYLVLVAVVLSVVHDAVAGTAEVEVVVRTQDDYDTVPAVPQVGGVHAPRKEVEVEAQEEVEART